MVYHTSEKISLEELESDLKQLSSLKDGNIQIKPIPEQNDTGPTRKLLTELFYQVMIKKVY